MYGSRKRIKQTSALANEFKTAANDTQREIDMLKSANPFESAAAKSAMATASQNSKQFYNRAMNQLGANASPEAIVAAQGAATAGQSGAAGSIAVGAEANKLNEINALRGLKENQMNTYGATKQSSINQIALDGRTSSQVLIQSGILRQQSLSQVKYLQHFKAMQLQGYLNTIRHARNKRL